jgi:hypothetical protein
MRLKSLAKGLDLDGACMAGLLVLSQAGLVEVIVDEAE